MEVFIAFLYWLLDLAGIVISIIMIVAAGVFRYMLKSVTEDVERMSLKIIDSGLNIFLLIIICALVLAGTGYAIFYVGGVFHTEWDYMLITIVTMLSAFVFFERLLISFICFLILRQKDSSIRFLK